MELQNLVVKKIFSAQETQDTATYAYIKAWSKGHPEGIKICIKNMNLSKRFKTYFKQNVNECRQSSTSQSWPGWLRPSLARLLL